MLETALLLTIFAAVGARRSVRDVLRAAPPAYRVFAVALAAAMLAGQLATDPHGTYPFVDWAMYSKPIEGDVVYYRLSMIGAGGREEGVPVLPLFPGAGRYLRSRLSLTADDLSRLSERSEQRRVRDEIEAILEAIRARYDEQHPDAPMRELRYARCAAPVRIGSVGASDCDLLFSIGPGRS